MKTLHWGISFLAVLGLGFFMNQPTVLGSDNHPAAAPHIGGCAMYPADNAWNTRVDTLPLDPRSRTWLDVIDPGRNIHFHMDFGSGIWPDPGGGPIGIPYNVVTASVPKVSVTFDDSPDESDAGPYPVPASPLIESGSDSHLLIVDTSACKLYELFAANQVAGVWHAGSGAIWDLNSNALRPDTWTSADAAGLPILPGLVRYDEVLSGEIQHAIRFTVPQTNGYIWPGRHKANTGPLGGPPMGARFRLKASFDIDHYPDPLMRVILRAMREYGIILADNGSTWYISGVPDERWDNDMLQRLNHALTGANFEAVNTSFLMVNPDSGQAFLPTFTHIYLPLLSKSGN